MKHILTVLLLVAVDVHGAGSQSDNSRLNKDQATAGGTSGSAALMASIKPVGRLSLANLIH